MREEMREREREREEITGRARRNGVITQGQALSFGDSYYLYPEDYESNPDSQSFFNLLQQGERPINHFSLADTTLIENTRWQATYDIGFSSGVTFRIVRIRGDTTSNTLTQVSEMPDQTERQDNSTETNAEPAETSTLTVPLGSLQSETQ